MSKPNPLQGFFRKPKFSITLPSRGKWYPKNALDSTDGTVEVYAMTAADDTRFKTNEVLISHLATYDLIRSCIPQIKDPESVPVVDLDAIILSVRRASYGNSMDFTTSVPNTNLKQVIKLDVENLINSLGNAQELWDDQLIIQDGDLQLTITVAPLPLRSMFSTTRQLMKQQQQSEKLNSSDQDIDVKINDMDAQLKNLSSLSVNMAVDSIKNISIPDGYSTDRPSDIRQFVSQLDLEYYRAIQKHLEEQKKKISFQPVECTSTPEQITAGAPETWQATISFSSTNFFAA